MRHAQALKEKDGDDQESYGADVVKYSVGSVQDGRIKTFRWAS